MNNFQNYSIFLYTFYYKTKSFIVYIYHIIHIKFLWCEEKTKASYILACK